MQNESQSDETIFSAAIEIREPKERQTYLDEACIADPEQRIRVNRLIAAADRASHLFGDEQTEASEPEPWETPVEEAGSSIDRYKLLQKIGEGGMGVVYMAEQTEPVRRKVALKIIKLGMDTKQVVARFEAERQALALMNHPNIAKVIDAGATEQGRPYFVMELVKGVPITEFCDKNHLSTKERLELFIPVCQAIQHAHQKGIIHRDIKPSNVLVALFDGKPMPMIIDFGIAKATNQQLTTKTLFTNYAQMIGTPAYMSPEQAEGSQLDIDTRSDVYSLGVLLYELLTGSQPFPEKRLRSAGWAEMQRIIQEEEPPRPSTRLSTVSDDQRSDFSTKHHEDPGRISLILRRELDWIVMRCLEKDRGRRFETANALARDIERYLSGEIPESTPPTWSYQFTKLARKHRKTFAIAAMLTLILTAAAVFSSWQAIRATKAEKKATEQAQVATAVSDFLSEKLLKKGNPWSGGETYSADLTLRDAILTAAEEVEGSFTNQPLVEAAVRFIVGSTLKDIGARQEGMPHLQKAFELYQKHLDPDDQKAMEVQREYAFALSYGGSTPEMDKAEALLLDAFRRAERVEGKAATHTILILEKLAYLYGNRNTPSDAEAFNIPGYVEASHDARGPRHPTGALKRSLAWVRQKQARHAEAYKLHSELDALPEFLPGGERIREGTNHIQYANGLYALAHFIWWWDGDFDYAEGKLEEALKVSKKLVENGVPTDNILQELMMMNRRRGRYDDALIYAQELVDVSIPNYGATHKWTTWAAGEAVALHGNRGRWEDVVDLLQSYRQRGVKSPGLLAREFVANRLIGRTNELRQNLEQLFEEAGRNDAAPKGINVSWVLLSQATTPDQIAVATRIAREASKSLPRRGGTPMKRALLEGLIAFNDTNWDQARAQFEQVRHMPHARRFAALARFYTAMSLAKQEARKEAEQVYWDANGMLMEALPLPLKGLGHPYSEHWTLLPFCLIAREQCELQLFSKVMSPHITEATLAEASAKWEPVGKLLRAADNLCRDRKFAEAAALNRQAMEHPEFDLDLAIQEIAWFTRKAGLAELLSGNQENYFEICWLHFSRIGSDFDLFSSSAMLMYEFDLPPDLANVRAGLEGKNNLDSQNWQRANSGEAGFRPDGWLLLVLGRSRYRGVTEGDPVAPLRLAVDADHFYCALQSRVYLAMALFRDGDNAAKTEARQLLAGVEKVYAGTLAAGKGRLDPPWHDQAELEVVIREARRMMP